MRIFNYLQTAADRNASPEKVHTIVTYTQAMNPLKGMEITTPYATLKKKTENENDNKNESRADQ
jgi:hypothetical protein